MTTSNYEFEIFDFSDLPLEEQLLFKTKSELIEMLTEYQFEDNVRQQYLGSSETAELLTENQLAKKNKSKLIEMVVQFQTANNIRQQHLEQCSTVVFHIEQLTSDDMRELEKLAVPYCYSTYSDENCQANDTVKYHCDSSSNAEKLYNVIEDWAFRNNMHVRKSAIKC